MSAITGGQYVAGVAGLGTPLQNAGAPTDGAAGTFAGTAPKGALLIDTTNGALYQNTGTQAEPTWTEIGAAAIADNSVTNDKLGADVKAGSLAALTTTAQGSLQAAINEVDANADAAQADADTANTNIGTLGNLTTAAQNNLVAAINEVDAAAAAAQATADAAYVQPGGGIPEADLDAATQAKLATSANTVVGDGAGYAVISGTITLNGVNPTPVVFTGADTAASITGTADEAFALANGNTLIVDPDGAGDDTVTFAATAGTSTGDGGGTENISAGADNKFMISVDGDAAEEVALNLAACTSGANTAAEMQSKIQALGGNKAGVTAAWDTDHYIITSGTSGTGSSVVVTRAAGNNVTEELLIGVADGGTETAGTGDAANIAAATAAEVAAAITAKATGWSATAVGTKVRITSDTTGGGSSLVVNAASTADLILGITGSNYGAQSLGFSGDMADTNYVVSALVTGLAGAPSDTYGTGAKATTGFNLYAETAAATDDVDVVVYGVPA